MIAFVVVPAVVVAFLAIGLAKTTKPKAQQGSPAPAFQLPVLGGGTLSSLDLKGVPVVINVWASWCIPCREEAPVLEAAYEKFKARGVRFVGVDYNDTESDAAGFVKEFGITYPSVRDTDGTLARSMGVSGVPETFFVDTQYRFFGIGQGQQVGTQGGTKILGALQRSVLVSQVEQLLAFKPPVDTVGSSPVQG